MVRSNPQEHQDSLLGSAAEWGDLAERSRPAECLTPEIQRQNPEM